MATDGKQIQRQRELSMIVMDLKAIWRMSDEFTAFDSDEACLMGVVDNYIGRHWRGELSLIWSYWVNVVVLSLILHFPYTKLEALLQKNNKYPEEMWWFFISSILYHIILAIVVCWQLIGVWRSAQHHITNTGRLHEARIYQVLCGFGWLGWALLMVNLFKVTKAFYEMEI